MPDRQCGTADDRFMAVRSRRRTSAPGRSATVGGRPLAEVHDRPLSEGGIRLIRIRPRDKWSYDHNSLEQHRACRILHELVWRVMRTEIGGSGSCTDQPKQMWQ